MKLVTGLVRTLFIVFVASWLAACGGGGDSAGTPPTNPPANPPAGDGLRLVVSATTVEAQATTSGSAATRDVVVSAQNLPTPDTLVYFSRSFTTNGIQNAQFSFSQPGTGGVLMITFKSPTILAPGVYRDTIEVRACLTSPCANPTVAGSPATIAVTYTVGSSPSATTETLVLSSNQVSVEALSSEAIFTTAVPFSIQNMGASTIYLGGVYSTNGISSGRFDLNETSGNLVILFKSPQAMAPGTYSDTMTVMACREYPCVNHIAGSPQTITVSYTVKVAPITTSVVFHGNAAAVTGNNQTSNASFKDESIRFTLTNPVGSMRSRTTLAGGGAVVIHAAPVWPINVPQAEGYVELNIRPPSTLGAGTYTDSVLVEFCMDSDPRCPRQAIGSPVTLAVTYTVTGSPIPTVQAGWSASSISGAELITSETRSPKLTLTLRPTSPVHTGVYARHGNSTTGLITNVVETSVARGSQFDSTAGNYDVFLKAPATLGSGTFTDTMQFEACFDRACTVPVPNSSYTLSVSITIAATEGVEFSRRAVPINGSTEAAWSAATGRLYVASSFGTQNRLTQVDPVAMTVSAGPALGVENLQHLAVTTDGSYLYAGSRARPFIHRLLLPAMTVDLSVPLGNHHGSEPFVVNDLKVIPGQPQSFVAALAWSSNNAGIVAYDNGTARPVSVPVNPAQIFETGRWLLPATTPGTFISQSFGQSFPPVNNIDLLTLDTNGIRVTSSTASLYPFGMGRPAGGASRLYLFDGKVLNASDGALLGQLAGLGSTPASAMVVDEARGRIVIWTQVNQKEMLLVYDLDSLALLANAPVYGGSVVSPVGITNRRMTAWGSSGLALVDGTQVIVLAGPLFTK